MNGPVAAGTTPTDTPSAAAEPSGGAAGGRHVVVVGGGLAGMTAALKLADAGVRVTLVEGRPRLGGSAFSFERKTAVGTLSVDNGQHVFLRCCTAYRGFLDRIGATPLVHLQDRLDIPVRTSDGEDARLRRGGLPAPLHLMGTLATYGVLRPTDRLRAVRAALAMRGLDPADPALDRTTLGAFLARHGQTPAVVSRLWGVVATATLNLGPDDASLALAAKVVRTGLLDAADAADMGYARVPLGELHHTAAGRALADAGVDVRLGVRVQRISPLGTAGGAFTVAATQRDEPFELSADGVVLAVPHAAAAELLPPGAHPDPAALAGLGASPIINVHVIYDRRVTDLAMVAAVDSPAQWVFDRTHGSGLDRLVGDGSPAAGAQYLAASVSAAAGLVDQPVAELRPRFLAEFEGLFPEARRAEVLEFFVTRERRATFRQAPGSAALRAEARTAVPGLWLAGSWTATGWPDTMESAVRSGMNAATAALGELSTTTTPSGAAA